MTTTATTLCPIAACAHAAPADHLRIASFIILYATAAEVDHAEFANLNNGA